MFCFFYSPRCLLFPYIFSYHPSSSLPPLSSRCQMSLGNPASALLIQKCLSYLSWDLFCLARASFSSSSSSEAEAVVLSCPCCKKNSLFCCTNTLFANKRKDSTQRAVLKFKRSSDQILMVGTKSINKYPAGGWLGLVTLVSL